MSSRSRTVRNRNHPKNICHEVGQSAKCNARTLSNAQLDEYITAAVSDDKRRTEILAMTRAQKLKLIKNSAMDIFARQYEEAVKKQQEEKESKDAKAKD